MTGKIMKGIGGFYYVYVEGSGLYECRARGIFRNKKMKPNVGDVVDIDILSEEENIDIVINQLENLSPEIVINRITGDPKLDDQIQPTRLVKKFCVLNNIDKEMVKRNTYQGKNI